MKQGCVNQPLDKWLVNTLGDKRFSGGIIQYTLLLKDGKDLCKFVFLFKDMHGLIFCTAF